MVVFIKSGYIFLVIPGCHKNIHNAVDEVILLDYTAFELNHSR